MPRYSVLAICLDEADSIERSLRSLLAVCPDDREIVVVDGGSTDGSLDILQRFAERGEIVLHVVPSNRGEARQYALAHARGDIVIDQIDLDEEYLPSLSSAIAWYRDALFPDQKVLLLQRGAGGRVVLAPRQALLDVGGWHALQAMEDMELYSRLYVVGRLRWSDLCVSRDIGGPSRGLVSLRNEFSNYRVGRSLGFPAAYFLRQMAIPWKPLRKPVSAVLFLAAWMAPRREGVVPMDPEILRRRMRQEWFPRELHVPAATILRPSGAASG